MTSRPGLAAEEYLAKTVGKRLCSLLSITPLYAFGPSYFTDHDRDITYAGTTYKAFSFASLGVDRAEGGLKPQQVQATGFIDGQNIVIRDMAARRFTGASVVVRMVDWKYPWIQIFEQHYTITSVRYSSQGWIATLNTLTDRLQRPQGGRFSGVFSRRCGYVLGGEYCKANLTGLQNVGFDIGTIIDERNRFQATPARVENARFDNYFREGEFRFLFGAPSHNGTTTAQSLSGTTVLTDANANYTPDELAFRWLRILNSAGGWTEQYLPIISNTATTITVVASAPFTATVPVGKNYDVCPNSELVNLVVPVALYDRANLEVKFFFPTPVNIVAGESGILTPGCDGTITTCDTKFNNRDNYGGPDVDSPTPADILRPPEE